MGRLALGWVSFPVPCSACTKEGTWYFLWGGKRWRSLGWLERRGTGAGWSGG